MEPFGNLFLHNHAFLLEFSFIDLVIIWKPIGNQLGIRVNWILSSAQSMTPKSLISPISFGRNLQIVSLTIAALLLTSLAVVGLAGASEDDDDDATYRITIINLTPGQAFTPPVIATHSRSVDIFTLGEEASVLVQDVAENGKNDPLVMALEANRRVEDVVVGSAPLVPANNPGGTGFNHVAVFTISAEDARFISFISMLICTNDGFTGLDSVRLPKNSVTLLTRAYDARTEMNTEDFADMVPPCQGLIGEFSSSGEMGTDMSGAFVEDGIIIPHPGIIGGADLNPSVHGWNDPVAKIIIERID